MPADPWFRRLRLKWQWWRWFLGGPRIVDFIIGDRYHRQAYKTARERWREREPHGDET